MKLLLTLSGELPANMHPSQLFGDGSSEKEARAHLAGWVKERMDSKQFETSDLQKDTLTWTLPGSTKEKPLEGSATISVVDADHDNSVEA